MDVNLLLLHDNVSSPRGAPHGRATIQQRTDGPVGLGRVTLDRGGYDAGGAYWGGGTPLYCAVTAGTQIGERPAFRAFIRADDREAARAGILNRWPDLRIRASSGHSRKARTHVPTRMGKVRELFQLYLFPGRRVPPTDEERQIARVSAIIRLNPRNRSLAWGDLSPRDIAQYESVFAAWCLRAPRNSPDDEANAPLVTSVLRESGITYGSLWDARGVAPYVMADLLEEQGHEAAAIEMRAWYSPEEWDRLSAPVIQEMSRGYEVRPGDRMAGAGPETPADE